LKLFLGGDREASRRYRPFWTPTLYFLDPEGLALLDWPGFLPPHAAHPLLNLGEALVGLRRGRFNEVTRLLETLVEDYPDSVFAPDARWWLGVVRHVVEGDAEALTKARKEILDRYPASPAALRF
jgi:hypothetical protein